MKKAELIKRYKTMFDNVEWNIKTNEPKGNDLQICQEKLSHYTDIIQELESLDESASNGGEDVNGLSPETKAAIARLAQKHNEIDFCEWVGNNFIQTYSADGSVRWEEKKDSRFYKTAELWNLKSPSTEPSLGVSAVALLSELTGIPEYRLTADDNGEYIAKSTALKAMEQYASSREDTIRELREMLRQIDKALYIGKDLDDIEILKWYIDVCSTIKEDIQELLSQQKVH